MNVVYRIVAVGLLVTVGVLSARPVSAQGAAALASAGQIETVTVYRGQAMVTRVLSFDLKAGLSELVVTDLPQGVVGHSLVASADGAVQVQAVRFRTRAVQDNPRKEVADLQAEIKTVAQSLRANAAQQALLKKKETLLDNLETFSADRAKDDLAKGTLNAESLIGVADYIVTQRTTLAEAAFTLTEEAAAVNEKLALLQRQLAEMVASSTRTAREAVVFLSLPQAGKATVRLSYMVDGATWSPSYNLRTDAAGKEIALEYSAIVQQVSGEDWNGVKLTLSTAQPNMAADAPLLMPLWVTLTSDRDGNARGGGSERFLNAKSASELAVEQSAMRREIASNLAVRQSNQKDISGRISEDWAANSITNRLQILDLTNSRDVLLGVKDAALDSDAMAVIYPIPGGISVASRQDQQMVRIATMKLKGDFYYLAVPVMTANVYLQADMVNTSDIALLSGPVSSYMDGQFMGTGRLPVVVKGQRFTVGFGVDSQLRARRELVDKTETVQGGNRVMSFKYTLAMDNYKDKPVAVRVLDRLPDPKNADIRVTLGQPSVEISKDATYLATLRKNGILRWDVEVPAKASGDKAATINYDFKLEFDRNTHLTEPAEEILNRSKAEFQKDLER
ncbi:MAG: mucoidy inhibitor MuiA family protein [Phycisphaerae bacterium]|nr:mucoidy inhibitor MuiA family protein [Phycisphaerae bacterium]